MNDRATMRAGMHGRWCAIVMALAGMALVTAAGAGPGRAEASSLRYCLGTIPALNFCNGTDHSLTGNEAFNNSGNSYRVCAGAVSYGAMACGNSGYAVHCYSGSNLLTPTMQNGESLVTQAMYAYEWWGSDAPSGC